MAVTECISNFQLTTDTPIRDKLWGVCFENIEENWPRYNGITLYIMYAIVSWPNTKQWRRVYQDNKLDYIYPNHEN